MRRVLDLHSKPGNGEVDARDHRDDRANPHPSRPKPPPPTIRQEGGDHANHKGANRRRGSPAIPPHFGREERHCGIHNIARAMHAWKYDSERGIDGEKCKLSCPCDDIYERERRSGGKCKSREWVDCHAPNPIMLFKTWPTRKLHQTIKARRAVRAARVMLRSCSRECRQQTQ